MVRRIRCGWLLLPALIAGCSITTQVTPLPRNGVSVVCIKENPAVWSEGFLPELRAQFERRGIQTTTYRDAKPPDCRYHVEYTANWYWDMAVYLQYADIRVYDGDTQIGSATYDARHGSARLDKFGTTSGKLDGIMEKMLDGTPRKR